MADEVKAEIRGEDDIVVARRLGRELASQLGFSITELTLIATAVSEIARNIVMYASEGWIRFQTVQSGGRHGLLVTASDEGPGIADLDLAMQDGYSTAQGLGLGLPGARRLMDHFEISTEIGVGTTVVMTKWVR